MAARRRLVKTQRELSQVLGVAHKTIEEWMAKGAPRAKGGYDPAAVQAWADANLRRGPLYSDATDVNPTADVMRGGDRGELVKSVLDYKRVRTATEALKLRRLQGELIEYDLFRRTLAARAAEFRRGLQGLERSLPPLLQGLNEREIQTVLAREFRHLLDFYSRAVPAAVPDAPTDARHYDDSDS